jgi:hypothetical protein
MRGVSLQSQHYLKKCIAVGQQVWESWMTLNATVCSSQRLLESWRLQVPGSQCLEEGLTRRG